MISLSWLTLRAADVVNRAAHAKRYLIFDLVIFNDLAWIEVIRRRRKKEYD